MKTTLLTATAVAAIALLSADPALAQFAGGGAADPGFGQGLRTFLNWILLIGGFVAVAAFMFACFGLFMRNLMMFAGGVLGVLIGGVLLFKAPTIVTALTGLGIV